MCCKKKKSFLQWALLLFIVLYNFYSFSKFIFVLLLIDPSTVYPDPNTGGLEVELDQGFMLTCDITGNPQPKIKWYFAVGSQWIIL